MFKKTLSGILLLLLLLPTYEIVAQSTVTIGPGSSISVTTSSLLTAGYRDGTMSGDGTFNSRSIVLDPVATAASSILATSFQANWNASAGANGYKIDLSTTSTFSTFVTGYQNLDVGSVTNYAITGLTAGTQYYFRLRAYDIDGITGYSNTISVLTVPAAPVASAATSINESSFIANWGASSSASKYYIDVATDAAFTSLVTGWDNKDIGNVTTYSVSTNLSAITTYYYRIRAANATGSSTNSNTITVLTAPLSPVAIAAASITKSSFLAKWNASAGATGYYLDVSSDSNFTAGKFITGYQNLSVGNVTQYSVNSNISAGTIYYYRVRSTNGDGISTNSNRITTLTVPDEPVAKTAASIAQTSFTAGWTAEKGATKYYLDVATDAGFTTFVADWENVDVGSDTSKSVNTNLAGGTNYYYRVRANNASGTSGNSNEISLITIPPNPVSTAATNPTQTSFDANWNAALGASGYRLDVSTSDTFSGFVTGWQNVDVGNVTTYSVNTNLTAGTLYYYRIRAYNSSGTSGNSNSTSITIVPPEAVAIAPANVGETSFSAKWNAALGATKYYLDVATDNGFTAFVAGWQNVDVGNVTTYSVNTNLTAATDYYYRVRSSNSSGTAGNSNTISLITAPLAPVATAGTNAALTSFSANWNPSATATGYLLDVSTDSNFGDGTFVVGYQGKDVGNVVTYSVSSNLTSSTTYYYRLRAYNSDGTGSNSNVITYGTIPGSPIEAAASSILPTGFTANWNSVSGATGYKLDVSTASDFSSFVAGYNDKNVGNVQTSSVTGLTENTTYYYRIRAFNNYGEGGNSGLVTVLTAPVAPVADAASNIDAAQFTANWQATAGATGYYLDVSAASNFSSFIPGFNSKDVGNVTSYLVSGLSRGTTYYYRLRAYNSGGSSVNSNDQSALTLPAPPAVAAASGTTATAFDANWSASTSATGYMLDVSTDVNFGAGNFVAGYQNLDVGNVVTYNVSGLSAGTTYYYRLRAYNASGTDGNSSTITVVTIPSAPVEQAATSITSNSFIANWDASGGANGYYLDVATNSGFTAGTFVSGYQNLDVGNVISYSVSGLTVSTQYYYRVRAYNAAGTSSSSGTASPSTLAGIPKAPAVSPATSVASASFSANWSASVGATGYRLDVSEVFNFASFVTGWSDVDVGNVITYSVNSNISAGTNYYYRLRAVNSAGTSGNSTVISVVTVPAAPTEQAATGVSNSGFTANWTASTGATGYKLDVSTANDFSSYVSGYDNLDVGNSASYSVTGLVGGVTYYYRISAYNTGGSSAESGTITQATDADPAGTVNATAATSVTSSGFDANWNAYGGATGYNLDVSLASDFSSYVSGYQNLDVGNVTTYTVAGLSGGTNYYYRVRAYDGGGTIANSGTINVVTVPSAPAVSAASSVNETYFTANWTASTGATGYYLDAATDNGFTSFVTGFNNKYVNSSTSYTVTGLTGGTTYYYRVRAKNSSGTSASSLTESVVTIPAEPHILSASSVASAGFNANWSSTTGATGYKLDVSTVSDFSSVLAAYDNVDVGNVTTSAVSGLDGGTTYYYRIKAYNASGTGSLSDYINVSTAPAAPVESAATSLTQSSFVANWNSVTGATKYYLDVATTSDFTGGTFITGYQNRDVGNVTSFSVTNLTAGTNYYYRIRAYNGNGTSSNSGTVTVTTVPPDPVVLSATNIASTSFSANWSASTGATKYYLDVATDIGFTSMVTGWSNVDVGNVVTYNVNSNISANTTYYYRVRAYNSSGTSGNSGIATVSSAPPAPVATAAASQQETNFVANWNTSTGANGYKIDVSAASDFSSFVSGFNDKDAGNTTSYIITGLSGGTTYYYRVRAYAGGRSSSNSNTITALTKPPAPVSTAATSVSSSILTANWNTAASATKYYLELSTESDFSSFVAGYNPKDAGNATTYSVTGLTANTVYYYRTSAENASGTGSVSNIITVLTAPAAPVSSAASSITNVSFYANWSASTGATGYKLDVATDAGFTSFVLGMNDLDVGNVTTYQVTSLSGNTPYYYRVRAYNSGGVSGNSGTQNPTTLVDPSAPPVAAAATSIAENSFDANWGSVAAADGYKLDVATNNTFTSYVSGFQDLNVGDVVTKTITGLTAGTTYYYRVRSYNISGTSSNSGTISTITLPVAPVSSAATALTATGFTSNWNSVSSATTYYLDVSTDSGFGVGTFVPGFQNKDVGNVVSSAVTGLSNGTTYYYRVRAANASGSGANSGSQTALTVPAAPVANAATSITQTSFTANWNSSTSATKYFLDVSTDAAFGAGNFVSGYNNKDVGAVTTFAVSGLSANSSYYYRVRAQNASGTSANSNVITAIGIPSATAATSVASTSFTANWNIVSGATGYKLDVSTDSSFATYVTAWQDVDIPGGAVVSKNVNTNLTAYTIYYYRIRSYDGSVTSANSNRINLTTAPVAPVANAASSITSSSFVANWTASAGGAAGYRLDVSTDAAFGAGTFVAGYENLDVANVTADTIDTNLLAGTNYYYRVRAYSSSAVGLNSNTTSLQTKMSPPNTRQGSNVTQTSFDANWDFSTSATKYYLDVATDYGFTAILPAYNDLDVGNVNTYSISGLVANTKYYYRLRAFNPTETTASSNPEMVLTNSLPPVADNATAITDTSFTANWTPQGGNAPGYKIDVARDAAFTDIVTGYQELGIANNTFVNVKVDMTLGVPYFYRVKAVSSFGESGYSNIKCAAKQPANLSFVELSRSSFSVDFNASKSGGSYLVVRNVGAQPTFVPADGNAYTIGDQGADRIVYVGSDTSFVESSITSTTTHYYKIYNYHVSSGTEYYIADSPLAGSNQIVAGNNSTGVIPASTECATTLFPDVGATVVFTSGTGGTSLTASKTESAPSSGIGLSNVGVNTLEPLYFSFTSTNTAPGVYELVLDFSSLGYSNWNDFKVLKRANENAEWQDVTLSPINAVITNRSTDGIPGKFTITGLSSFSQFVIGRFVNSETPQSIRLLSPEGGVTWLAGSTHTIAWQKTGNIAGVKLEYSTNNGDTWTQILGQALVALSSYNWVVPGGFNSDQCLVRVSNWYNTGINSVSSDFTIKDPEVPYPYSGDVDNNGSVSAYDASLVLQYMVGKKSLSSAECKAADVNRNNCVDDNDAARILSYTVSEDWNLSKKLAASGKLTSGNALRYQDGKIVIPINGESLFGVTSAFVSIEAGNLQDYNLGFESKTESGCMMASNFADGKLLLAIASAENINSGILGNLIFTPGKNKTNPVINVLYTFNGELSDGMEIDLSKEIPLNFELSQNYPNPFNPVTAIKFGLPVESRVTLKIYNLLGEEISIISNGDFAAGSYEFNFNASNLSSGVYIYRFEAAGSDGRKYRMTKKMVLMK